jgi:predicted nucleotidyltransferase
MVAKRDGSEIIRNFLNEAKKVITIEKAILFGSYTTGKASESSDIDIAVISADFRRFKPIDRLVLLGKIAWRAHTTQIEALGYTPEEYRDASKYDFLFEIKKKGKLLFKTALESKAGS